MASNYYYPVQHSRSSYSSYGNHHAVYPPSHHVMSYQHAPHANMNRQYNLPRYGFDAKRRPVQPTSNFFVNDYWNTDSKRRRRREPTVTNIGLGANRRNTNPRRSGNNGGATVGRSVGISILSGAASGVGRAAARSVVSGVLGGGGGSGGILDIVSNLGGVPDIVSNLGGVSDIASNLGGVSDVLSNLGGLFGI
ncbi:unnamed protein product [Rotaria magnacalcarata]|uniref:Uncharacterized protein n=2 Tax=Rotaria magnacalcarata TaxID=392030 RepID=A0A815PE93_9BILA|nr:unnamed protein product [Rotaria magnacalcarata]CAF1642383.1 unnamed protein product [Rotaria magnacalcarata]